MKALLFTLKSKAMVVLGSIAALLAPIQWVLILVGMFIVLDTCFGIWAAKKTKKKLTSRRFSGFISKMFIYQLVVITVYALDKLLLGEFLLYFINIHLVLTKITAICLIFAEVFSINEKLIMVKGKGFWSYFKRVIGLAKRIKSETEDLTEKED